MKTEHTKELFIEQLKRVPVIQVACEKVGLSRATYYRLRDSDKNFRRQAEGAMEQGFEFINDLSESQLLNLIKAGKMPAITLWLKVHHPRYGSRVKSRAPAGPPDDLTPEEQKIVLDALALVSGKTIAQNNHERDNPAISGKNPGEQKN